MKALPPPESGGPDFGDGLPDVMHEVIARGEQALRQLREDRVACWTAAGAAWKTMQGIAMYRSNSNQPVGRRYAAAYHLLEKPWPQLTKIDRKTRNDAIWLFEQEDLVQTWLATLSQKERDQWGHPTTIGRHYEKRHPKMLPDRPPPPWRDRNRHHRVWKRKKLAERSREDLEAMIGELVEQLADRERHIIELEELLAEKDRENTQLRNDLAWERAARMQLEAAAAPAAAPVTAIRPDGGTAEIVHAISRESQAITPPESHGRPDYRSWAGLVAERIKALSALELYWLLADNAPYIDAYEKALPGAGIGLKNRINARIAELEASP